LNKFIKVSGVVTMIVCTAVFFTGCSSEAEGKTASENTAVETQAAIVDIDAPIAELPMMITSAGQSADFDIAKTLMDKAGLSYDTNSTLQPGELGDIKTLVVSVGGSSKGLGAAGIDANDEVKRIESVVTEAKEKGIKVIALHTGGEGRRGDLSDKFVDGVMPLADYMIVVSTGDSDGYISGIAIENDIPMASLGQIADVIGALQKTFK